MRLKIVSDGKRFGTKVVNAETGEQLERVVAVNWFCDATDFDAYPRCEIIVEGIELDAEIETSPHVERKLKSA